MRSILICTAALGLCVLPSLSAGIVFSYNSGVDNLVSVSSTDLLQTSLASSSELGSFGNEGTALSSVLTDGLAGATGSTGWTGIGDGAQLTYMLDTTSNPAGYTIDSVVITTGWGDNGRILPNVTVSYSLVGSPTSFVSLGTATMGTAPDGFPNPWITSTIYDDSSTPLASSVASIRFDFGPQQNGFVGYREIDVLGPIPEPSAYAAIAGVLALVLAANRRRR